MKRDNRYLYEALNLMENLQKSFKTKYDEANKYSTILNGLSEATRESELKELINIEMERNKSLREDIEVFIMSLNIKRLEYKLGKFILNKKRISYKPEEDNIDTNIKDVENIYLLQFLIKILRGVAYVQKENLLLVKYNKSGLYFGYNNLYNCCRGKVIDLETNKIVAYAFDKFFNLNESEETNIKTVRQLLSRANAVSIMDKLDGTLVSTTQYKNDLLVTTNGEFNNEFIDISKDLIKSKYPELNKKTNPNYTYIFELIHPCSRVVVDYNNEEKLILTSIRDLKDNRLLTYEECKVEANRLGLEIVTMFEDESFDTIIEKASTLKNCNREGWVLRIITDSEDILIKLKLDDYSALHKTVLSDIKPIQVFELIQKELLDDVIAKTDNKYKKQRILSISEEILNLLSQVEDSLIEQINRIIITFNIDREEILNALKNKDNIEVLNKRIELVKYINKNFNKYYDKTGSLKYFINAEDIETIMKNITKREFRQICEKSNLNILNEKRK